MGRIAIASVFALLCTPTFAQEKSPSAQPASEKPAPEKPAPEKPRNVLEALIAEHARANGVPEALIHRVIKRESRYNASAVGRGGAMGLMQIKHATARALGYSGPAAGLLDPATNLTYAVRYLAGALHAAQGNAERGYALYRSGYYKGKGKRRRAALAQAGKAPPRPDADPWGLRGGK